ncbi:hypothetical protein [Endothiovibrio diazotrophicus]
MEGTTAWTLRKAPAIKRLLLRLGERFGADTLALDTRPTEHQAIHLALWDQPALAAYVHTYGQPADRFGLHLEFPATDGQPLPPEEVYEELTAEQLLEALAIHFELPGNGGE